MGKHRRTSRVARYLQTVPAHGVIKVPQSDSLGRATLGVAALALVVGSLGAEAAAVSSHGAGELVGAGQQAVSGHAGPSYHLASAGSTISQRPWMY